MHFDHYRFCAGVLLVLTGAVTAAGGQAEGNSTSVPSTIACTVTDKKGDYVSNLHAGDFQILEKNQELDVLEAETDHPRRIVVLIDISGSVRAHFPVVQEEAMALTTRILRPQADKVLIAGFNASIHIATEFTDDKAKLEDAIRQLKPNDGTALRDAVYSMCRRKLQDDGGRQPQRFVLLTDGHDNASRVGLDQVLKAAQSANVVISAIADNLDKREAAGDLSVLRKLAVQTGGQVVSLKGAQDLNICIEGIRLENVQRVYPHLPAPVRGKRVLSRQYSRQRAEGVGCAKQKGLLPA